MDFSAAATYMDQNYPGLLVLIFFAVTYIAFKWCKMSINVLRDPHESFVTKFIVLLLMIPAGIWMLFIGSLVLVFFMSFALVVGEKASNFIKRL